MNKFENILCFRAFTELYIDIDNKIYRPCCYFNKNTKYNNIEDFHQTIREDNLKNQWSSGCEHCKKVEELNSTSHRLEYFHKPDQSIISNNKFVLKHLELRLDNVCNIACITCDANSSSRWASEDARMYNKPIVKKNKQDNYDWLLDEKLWENVETLVLYGGEPFYSKKLKNILSWLVEKNFSKNITLNFYTNGTIFDDTLLVQLSTFKLVDIQFSIDGVEENFEIIRWPAKWVDILNNINNVKKFSNIIISINYTVSILNIFNIEKDFHSLRKDLTKKVNFNFLEEPNYYNIKNLPENFKNQIITTIGKNLNFISVINKLNRNGDSNVLKECASKLKTLDRFRNTHSHLLFPEEFANYLFDTQS